MRVISQYGADFPYEQIVVELDGCRITCKPVVDMEGKRYTLGEYSAEEKARKVMEMLINAYKKYLKAANGSFYFAFNHPKVFRFPQDSEMEV